MTTTITLETLRFWVFVASIVVVIVFFVFIKSKEARFKQLLRRELRDFNCEEISDWEFQGGNPSSYSHPSSTLMLEFYESMTTKKLWGHLKTSLESRGFVLTPLVRRNGGVYTLTVTKGKIVFNMTILQGIHVPNSFHLTFEVVPALIPIQIND